MCIALNYTGTWQISTASMSMVGNLVVHTTDLGGNLRKHKECERREMTLVGLRMTKRGVVVHPFVGPCSKST